MGLENAEFATERLIIRAPHAEDAAELSALMTPEINRWLAAWPNPLTETAAAEIIAARRTDAAAGVRFSGVVRRRDGPIVGWMDFVRLVGAPGAGGGAATEFSCWYGENHQR